MIAKSLTRNETDCSKCPSEEENNNNKKNLDGYGRRGEEVLFMGGQIKVCEYLYHGADCKLKFKYY